MTSLKGVVPSRHEGEDQHVSSPKEASPSTSEDPQSPSFESQSSTVSTESLSSTVAHQQTSFDQFSLQVEELCQLLWSSLPDKDQIAVDNVNEYHIERLEGGTFNRITGIAIIPSLEVGDPLRLILRTPRSDWSSRPDCDLAILRHVRNFTSIPVPEVLHYDFTSNNPLNQLYVIQTRMSGYSLQRLYPNLSHDQHCVIAKTIGEIILAVQAVTSSRPGLIESNMQGSDIDGFVIRPFDIKEHQDREWKSRIQDHENWTQAQHEKYYGTTVDFLVAKFGRWRADELKRDPSSISWWDYQHRLVDVALQMSRLGIFKDDQICLCHLDLAARNILVDVPEDEPLTLSGVLDWDSAIFAPKFVSCAPPWWVWADDTEDDGADWDEQDETRALKTPPTLHGQELKRMFEETVGEDNLRLSYEPQYRLARKLFHFAMNGLHQNEDIHEAEKLFEEWRQFYDDIMKQAMEEPSVESESNDSSGDSRTDTFENLGVNKD